MRDCCGCLQSYSELQEKIQVRIKIMASHNTYIIITHTLTMHTHTLSLFLSLSLSPSLTPSPSPSPSPYNFLRHDPANTTPHQPSAQQHSVSYMGPVHTPETAPYVNLAHNNSDPATTRNMAYQYGQYDNTEATYDYI